MLGSEKWVRSLEGEKMGKQEGESSEGRRKRRENSKDVVDKDRHEDL